jgi:hypothetical protein
MRAVDITPVHFARTDPRLLGETLVMAASVCFVKSEPRHVTYECNGQWLRFIAEGKPYKVVITEVCTEAEVIRLEHTGDGLTYRFGDPSKLKPVTGVILTSAKDHAQIIKHA